MLAKFKEMSIPTKCVVSAVAVLGLLAVGLLIAVLATGGFSNPLA